jgi:tRNA uridine 5-carboxymethylaminomethyl modification enzyme
MSEYDVIVIGGGHAGAEAAALAARAGARALLLTQNLETIGQMSCNPAIGGIAKGTVVREIDALGGVMGRATDRACVQFRMLNRSKGPAVWSPRAQCDRALYRSAVRYLLERQPKVSFRQGTAASLIVEGGTIRGIVLGDGARIRARAVVLTAGTFLRGRIHVGTDTQIPAGRAGDEPAVAIAEAIVGLGLTSYRFKTGTPPRIDGRTVDFTQVERQDGDAEPYWFSAHERAAHPAQLPCFVTYTDDRLRSIIQRHLGDSALYGGAISGRGPRYCPSIEDKIVKFPDAGRHQVFLEPEGLQTSEMYVNGLSTSLPAQVQLAFLRTVPGLERVEMTRAGYAIEYDYFPPTQLRPTLEVRQLEGLFFAGQINGTTGYEEAAGQGAMAGVNAAARALELEPLVLGRDESIVGVLIDDLVTRGVDEPYRLFTSRVEHRLLLRQDNALRRLLPAAERYGLLTDEERGAAHARIEAEDRASRLVESRTARPEQVNDVLTAADSTPIREPTRLGELVRRPGVRLADLLTACGYMEEAVGERQDRLESVEIELKYGGYVARERASARRLKELESFSLPDSLEYRGLASLSFEAREKLQTVRPATLGQAGRIPGVSPSDLQNLVMEVLKHRRRDVSRETSGV